MAKTQLEAQKDYKYGFHDADTSVFKSGRGLTKHLIEEMSEMKGEPQWMRQFRLKALDIYNSKPMPSWGNTELIKELDFDNIRYYVRPSEKTEKSWDEVPEGVRLALQVLRTDTRNPDVGGRATSGQVGDAVVDALEHAG